MFSKCCALKKVIIFKSQFLKRLLDKSYYPKLTRIKTLHAILKTLKFIKLRVY